MRLAKFDDAGFGPEAFITRGVGDESAVAAVFGSDELDIAIAADGGIAESVKGDERVVLSGDDEGGNADGGDVPGGGGAVVVVVRVAETAMRGGNFVVEFADGADFIEAFDGVFVWEELNFGAHASFEAADKVGLVDEVLVLGKSLGAGVENERRADGNDTAKLERRVVAHFAGHFKNNVAAHGETYGENFGKRGGGKKFFDDGFDIAAEAGIVEAGGEFFGAAAVALIEADGIETGDVGFFSGAEHVAGLAGAFEAVKQDDCGVILGARVPVAMGEDARAGFGFKFASEGRGKAGVLAAPKRAGHGHEMTIAKERLGIEFAHRN
jgi:hypothetical protein